MTPPNLTPAEREVLESLKDAWNQYRALDGVELITVETIEFQTSIHRAQDLIALRVARRVDPDVWA